MPPRPKATIPISAEEESVWPDVQAEMFLPPGMTPTKAWAIHSIPYLLRDFDLNTCQAQLVPHRGIPDGCIEALRRATTGEKGEGGNAVELDPLWIAGKPYVMHDLTGDWRTPVGGCNVSSKIWNTPETTPTPSTQASPLHGQKVQRVTEGS